MCRVSEIEILRFWVKFLGKFFEKGKTDGAKGGTRTHTLSLAADFESAASTNSATLASAGYFIEKNCSCLAFSFIARCFFKQCFKDLFKFVGCSNLVLNYRALFFCKL